MERSRLSTATARPVVLIVDEHEETLALYAMGLFAMGFDVVPARDGVEAYRRAGEVHPDIIVTQLMTSNADSSELLQQLQEDARTRNIPVVGWRGSLPDLSGEPLLPQLAAGLREILARERT